MLKVVIQMYFTRPNNHITCFLHYPFKQFESIGIHADTKLSAFFYLAKSEGFVAVMDASELLFVAH